MTMNGMRPLIAGVLVTLAVAATAAAQTPSAVLNALEVRALVASGEPEDHATLSAHFAALADHYDADAKRHSAMSHAFVGNPNRTATAAGQIQFARLGVRDRELAITARELAAHHTRLAAGHPSTTPAGSVRFEAGFGAREPTPSELHRSAAEARTATDHHALAEYYLAAAAEQRALIARHTAMAGGLRGNTARRTLQGDAAVHCDHAVRNAREAERESLGRALMHRQFATIG